MKVSIKSLWREPLVHFLLIGAALFLFYGLVDERGYEAQNRIVVNDAQVEQLMANFKRTWMRPPTQDELAALVENHVRDEVFYREALAMGLDQNDMIVRQRLRTKLEFILEDLSSKNATDEVLAVYLKQHPDKFRTETQLSFRQVFLDSGKRKDLAADAKILLAELNKGSAPESLGDSSMLPGEFSLASQSEIARPFGERFSAEMIKLNLRLDREDELTRHLVAGEGPIDLAAAYSRYDLLLGVDQIGLLVAEIVRIAHAQSGHASATVKGRDKHVVPHRQLRKHDRQVNIARPVEDSGAMREGLIC